MSQKFTDWDATASNNTTVGTGAVDIAENCLPGGVNDALREIMAACVRSAGLPGLSGTARPTGTQAGQFWFNTTTATAPILTFYDGTDDIAVATIDYSADTFTLASTVVISTLVSASNGNITLTPDGIGNVVLGNYVFDGDQSVGAGQDNYVLTYDHSTGLISLEAAAGGGGGGLDNVVEDLSPQLGAALDGQGYDLNNMGVLFLTEQAAAEADVAGKGQWWVKTATPNVAMFTDDAGTDFQLATLTGTETLTNKTFALGSNTLSGTTAQFNTALSDGSFATQAGTETLTNKSLTAPTLTGSVAVSTEIVHTGDTNNKIALGTDTQDFQTGGSSRMDLSDSGVRLGGANARVTTVLDEDTMSSDSATSLATQQSIKAYVDAQVASGGGRVPLTRITPTATAALTFTSFNNSLYDAYEFVFHNVAPATGDILMMRTSTDGGSTYDNGATDYAWLWDGTQFGTPPTADLDGDDSDDRIRVSGDVNVDGTGLSGSLTLYGASIAQDTFVDGRVTFSAGGGTLHAFRNSAADVDAVEWRWVSAANFAAQGYIDVFGIPHGS